MLGWAACHNGDREMSTRLFVRWDKRHAVLAWPARLLFTVAVVLVLSSARLAAFSLLGPYADWMTPALSYRLPGDIGGPMNIGEGYRWNVPVVTYAFDQSFLDYFGSNGVAAVERAIQMLNDLPPASGIVPDSFPTECCRMNYLAGSENLVDLKSRTLALLLEQLGLTDPIRNFLALPRWDPALLTFRYLADAVPDYLMQRNFDPDTFQPSYYDNGVSYFGYLFCYPPMTPAPARAVVYPMLVYISDPAKPAVASWKGDQEYIYYPCGFVFVSLTQDDVGGLRYLLSTNNVALERLLPDVHGAGTNGGACVSLALRPGVEKITFVRQAYDSLVGQAIPITTCYTDTYITNGVVMHQQLERVIGQPDFLFCAADTGEGNAPTPDYVRTGTSNWWNSSTVSGGTNAGPGVIQPPVRITFNKLSAVVETNDPNPQANVSHGDYQWGSFDDSTNAPIVIAPRAAAGTGPMNLRFRLYGPRLLGEDNVLQSWHWFLTNCAQASLQVSVSLTNWATCAVVTNQGAPIEWDHWGSASRQEYFRIVPQ